MSKYGPLKAYLQAQVTVEIPLSFAEIEAILGQRLPASAYRHRPWWANEPSGHVHAQAWLEAGYATAKVDLAGQTLVFRRLVEPQAPARGKPLSGLSDAERRFADAEDAGDIHDGMPAPGLWRSQGHLLDRAGLRPHAADALR